MIKKKLYKFGDFNFAYGKRSATLQQLETSFLISQCFFLFIIHFIIIIEECLLCFFLSLHKHSLTQNGKLKWNPVHKLLSFIGSRQTRFIFIIIITFFLCLLCDGTIFFIYSHIIFVLAVMVFDLCWIIMDLINFCSQIYPLFMLYDWNSD